MVLSRIQKYMQRKLEMIDTPQRINKNQMPTSIGKFEEDSPVFSFVNSLSPIKPVKSVPSTQTINPLTFASCPSVFSSPHVISPKECRFIQRTQQWSRSKPKFISNDGNKDKSSFDPDKVSDDAKENLEPISLSDDGVASFELSCECSKLIVESAENLEYSKPKATT